MKETLIATAANDTSKLAQASIDVNLHPEYAKTLARMAYAWGYPMVNMLIVKTPLQRHHSRDAWAVFYR